MKILHIIYDSLGNPWVGGGGALRVSEINRHLVDKHEITVLTGNFPKAQDDDHDGIRYIHAGLTGSYLLSRISFALKIPFLIRKYEFDLLVNEFSVFSPCYCHWYTSKKVVHTFYHRIGKQAFRKLSFLGILPYLFEKLFLLTAKNIITISPSVTSKIELKGSKQNIRCIYTGVDSELFNVEPKPGQYIAFVGRLDIYMKGLDILIEAFSNLPDKNVRLIIAGSGPEKNRKKLESLIQDFDVKDRVELPGRISEEQKRELLSECFFLAMPSRFEGWGISAIEASACSKPVVGTDISGLSDAVRDGETGILVPNENSGKLTDAMNRLLQQEDLRTEMGKNAQEWAMNFRWDSIARIQEEFYEEVMRQ